MPKLSLLVRVSFCFLFLFLPLKNMDEWFYDRYFSIRGRQDATSGIVLVRVDDASLAAETKGPNWPLLWESDPAPPGFYPVWYASYYLDLIRRLESYSPRLVAFTTFFGSTTSGGRAAPRTERLVFASLIGEEQKLIPPAPWLTEGENHGFINLFPDDDNTIRQAPLADHGWPSLALRISHRLNDAPTKRDLGEAMWVDFRGPDGSYPSYPAEAVLSGTVPADAFAGKIVLIGRRGDDTGRFDTPFGTMSRLEIHANVLDTYLQGREIRRIPAWLTIAGSVGAVLASASIILGFPLYSAWMCLLLLALVLLVVSLFLFAYFKIWVGIANPLVCIFGTHLLLMGYKLGRQEEKQQRVQSEADHLKEMDQFKNNFISLFSHDLKTPIAKIKAIIERLLGQHPELSADVQDSLRLVSRTSDELARFISDILKVTRMETMSIEPSRDVIDLNRLVEEAVNRNRFLADEKSISLTMDLEPLFSMEGDQKLIEEVITNLLENAIKYSGPKTQVVVATHEEDNKVFVSITDQGPGIPEEEVPRVTSKFYRGKSAEKHTRGSGLGLYLAKYFVELHHGELQIDSTVGKGTRVRFWLPLPT